MIRMLQSSILKHDAVHCLWCWNPSVKYEDQNVCFHIKTGYSSKQLLKRKWFSTFDSNTAPLEFLLGNGLQMSQERSLVQHYSRTSWSSEVNSQDHVPHNRTENEFIKVLLFSANVNKGVWVLMTGRFHMLPCGQTPHVHVTLKTWLYTAQRTRELKKNTRTSLSLPSGPIFTSFPREVQMYKACVVKNCKQQQ